LRYYDFIDLWELSSVYDLFIIGLISSIGGIRKEVLTDPALVATGL